MHFDFFFLKNLLSSRITVFFIKYLTAAIKLPTELINIDWKKLCYFEVIIVISYQWFECKINKWNHTCIWLKNQNTRIYHLVTQINNKCNHSMVNSYIYIQKSNEYIKWLQYIKYMSFVTINVMEISFGTNLIINKLSNVERPDLIFIWTSLTNPFFFLHPYNGKKY